MAGVDRRRPERTTASRSRTPIAPAASGPSRDPAPGFRARRRRRGRRTGAGRTGSKPRSIGSAIGRPVAGSRPCQSMPSTIPTVDDLPARHDRGRPVQGSPADCRECGVHRVAPERFPRSARDGHDDPPVRRGVDVTRAARRDRRAASAGNSEKSIVAIRSGTPSRSTSADRGPADHLARPGGLADRAGQLRPFGIGASGSVQLGEVGPEDRPVLPREGQEGGPRPGVTDQVARAVAVQVGRRLDEPARSRMAREPEQPGMIRGQGLAGLPGLQGVPDDLAGRAVAPAQPRVRPLDEVGLAGGQLDRHRVGSEGDRLLPGLDRGFPCEGPAPRRAVGCHPM